MKKEQFSKIKNHFSLPLVGGILTDVLLLAVPVGHWIDRLMVPSQMASSS